MIQSAARPGVELIVSRIIVLHQGARLIVLDVADQNTADSTATIYAKFDGGNTLNAKVTPGCKLMASWPRDYGDLDFTDNCLKDRSGDYSQCCTDDTTTTDAVNNPYAP